MAIRNILLYNILLFGIFIYTSFAASMLPQGAEAAAGEATFGKGGLALKEGVHLQHPWGEVTAQAMTILPQSAVQSFSMGKVLLSGDVQLTFKQGGVLSSDYAELNPLTGEALLGSEGEENRVIYREGGDNKHSLELVSQAMTVKWDRGVNSGTPISKISEMICSGGVQLLLDDKIRIEGERARYLPAQAGAEEGSIVLEPIAEQGVCLAHIDGMGTT